MNYKTIVIGGGAAGMMAAATASRNGDSVVIIEKNEKLGVKLGITGGGRCNILNAEDDIQVLLYNYGEAKKFLFSAYKQFGMQDTADYFESIGLPIAIEDRKRAFPKSGNAKDVVNVLKNQLIKNRVTIISGREVTDINFEGSCIKNIVVDNKKISGDNYILATGGTSKPETGSTGDGLNWLKTMGHNIKKPTPNVTPLSSDAGWLTFAQGLKLENSKVSFYLEGAKKFTVNGSLLITHFGISGPMILNSAHKVSSLLKKGSVTAKIDCFPDLSTQQLDKKLIDLFTENPAKNIENTLRLIISAKLSNVVFSILENVEPAKNSGEVSKEDRQEISKLLKEIPLKITDLMGFEKAVVADGGVDLQDIDMRTMKSKIINNLYVTGDLLNINRPSGGFSLQLCWTTGFIAGDNCSTGT